MTTIDASVWPFPDLRLTEGDLELRYLSDDLLFQLATVAGQGIHAPDAMPFSRPWSRGTPVEVARSILRYQWDARARLAPEAWTLELAAVLDGRVIGVQSAFSTGFAVTRDLSTGSWLGTAFQGRGLGTRMRRMILTLAFDGLGARIARSDAFTDNPASRAVSRKLGYVADGDVTFARDGAPATSVRLRLDRQDWLASGGAPDVTMVGVEPVRAYLGLS